MIYFKFKSKIFFFIIYVKTVVGYNVFKLFCNNYRKIVIVHECFFFVYFIYYKGKEFQEIGGWNHTARSYLIFFCLSTL